MSYKITFIDKTELLVSNELAESLQSAMTGATPPQHFTLNNELFRVSQITSIMKYTEPNAGSSFKQLSAPPYNCAPYSIQKQIMMIAKKRGEVHKLKDESYRETMRAALRAKYPKKQWCDHREAEHACLSPGMATLHPTTNRKDIA